MKLCQAIAHASMNAESKRQVLARVMPFNIQHVCILKHLFVAVARQVPHDHHVARVDLLIMDDKITNGRAAHGHQWGLPAQNFRDQRADQSWIVAQLLVLVRKLIQGQ